MANHINTTIFFLLLAVTSQCQDLIVKEEGGLYGFFVKKKMVLDFQYDSIDQQFNGDYAVRRDGKWGLVSPLGIESIPCKYDFLYAATSSLYMASHEGLIGVVDSKGSVVLDFLFDKIDHVEVDTQALVRYQGRWCIYYSGTFDYNPEHFIFDTPEIMPMFPGCQQSTASDAEKKDCADAKMRQCIYLNIKYPAIAREKGIQGQVIVRFIVTREGVIENPVIVSGIGGGCNEEVLRVVTGMPNWIPAMQDGINVASKYTIPVKFILGNLRCNSHDLI